MSAPISVVIITLNEEIHIARALESVSWSNNVVVVDSHSADKTEEICKSYKNVIFMAHPFEGLARQRQFALDSGNVKHPWALALDADEIVPEALRDELTGIAENYESGDPVAYDIAMRVIMWGKWLKHSSGYPVYWRRFFLKDRAHYTQRGHADTVDVEGPVARAKNDLVHWNLRGMEDWLAKHNRYSTEEALYTLDELRHVPYADLFAGDQLRRRRALKRLFRLLPFNATLRFVHLYLFKLGFLDGWRGFHFCRLKALQNYIIKLKMRQLRQNRSDCGPED